jgi:23S rRNA C2498 (ribose-2'-O)-methylase RlmM
MKLTRRQEEVLRRVAWGTENFGALVTGRMTPVAVVRALMKKDLVADAGMVAVCDGDGFLVQPERYRQGWKITGEGKAVLKEVE